MIFEKVKAAILEQLEVAESDITMEASLDKTLGADALAVLDILISIEDYFHVDIPEKKTGLVIGDLVQFIEAHCPNLAELKAAGSAQEFVLEPEHAEVKKSA